MTESAAPIRVALVDDQQLVRAGFRMVLESQPDIEVVTEASDGEAAIAVLGRVHADVVLMDVQMPHLDGISATRTLLRDPDAPKVVVLTTFDNDEYVVQAIAAGASGFLLKDAPPEDLLSAVRTVHRGDAVMAPRATRRLLQHVSPLLGGDSPARRVELPEDLTPRELEVLVAMAHGLTNGEIAERFVLSAATVKTHVGRVLAKTGSRDRVQAVLFAFRAGLVRPDELLGTGE
ncbi:response regulator transcription factor [Rhodococcus rhodochrous]|uniref:response regulator transcription factor n=1 Tax=Rhodococcus rhodochrous TaxID=1829 RepID=UPI000E769AB8|nr:response regulator transcription factor [Rhodococcus rhodochrous]MCR8691016.1 response regulator transcription factor [Rhodococcus pyridinivorans]MCD2096875.1 response regulator transcription factor [Rhodococcus rhodochrous]MCD2121594.1 response regulator transcription factor [Rhodococcus rhodochrous]MCQ4137027.1 response regulator transcription factor [Rhodococcus rhodochrous]MDJ0018457.1 response regulator transcription factor [Rhodococcus rhodochrous]